MIVSILTEMFFSSRLCISSIARARRSAYDSSCAFPPSYSMGMTSCDAALTSTPGSRTMMARKMSSSATCCRSGETSVTSSCGENSGVRWQIKTYKPQDRDSEDAITPRLKPRYTRGVCGQRLVARGLETCECRLHNVRVGEKKSKKKIM